MFLKSKKKKVCKRSLTPEFEGPPTVLNVLGDAQNKLCHYCQSFFLKIHNKVGYFLTCCSIYCSIFKLLVVCLLNSSAQEKQNTVLSKHDISHQPVFLLMHNISCKKTALFNIWKCFRLLGCLLLLELLSWTERKGVLFELHWNLLLKVNLLIAKSCMLKLYIHKKILTILPQPCGRGPRGSNSLLGLAEAWSWTCTDGNFTY